MTRIRKQNLHGWGRFPVLDCVIETPRDEANLQQLIMRGPMIPRGAGRSYGDSALNPAMTISSRRFNRILDFDHTTRLITAESGVVLADIIRAFLPRGWFPAVVPGTQFVTVGGMVASDVHGKNHHVAGSFGAHVQWLDVMSADGVVVRCDRHHHSLLFQSTIGGMGLTGFILRAGFKLMPVETGWMRTRSIVAPNLEAAMQAFESHAHWTYSVAWIDCLAKRSQRGRSILHLGEHATLGELGSREHANPLRPPTARPLRAPFDAPSWLLNGLTVGAFNSAYFHLGSRKAEERLVDWHTYFFPLDSILDWNRIYGKRGVLQFQCVIPKRHAPEGIGELLNAIATAKRGSFLGVLKLFGPQETPFSFPMEGYTLALDLPADKKSFALLNTLDEITLRHHGRFYLAKDARLPRATFDASDSRIENFRALRQSTGMSQHFCSSQSQRLGL